MNEQIETLNQPASANAAQPEVRADKVIAPQSGDGNCGCGSVPESDSNGRAAVSFVYAIGRIEARFPNLAAEKEFAQAGGRTDTAGKTDQQTFHTVLSKRENRYLVRQLCWVLTIQGLETYLLLPRDPADINLLVEAIRPAPAPDDIDVVIGIRGPIAQPTMCNGLMVPIVAFDQIYSFDRDALIKAIPKPEKTTAAQFGPAAEELFGRIMQLTDNAGATDEHRALNYLAMRYPAIYAKAADGFARDMSLTGVDVRPSLLSGARKILDVIFAFTNRNTDFTEKSFVRVDVTEEFPFLVTKMSPYYDR
jgi:PatG Domain